MLESTRTARPHWETPQRLCLSPYDESSKGPPLAAGKPPPGVVSAASQHDATLCRLCVNAQASSLPINGLRIAMM